MKDRTQPRVKRRQQDIYTYFRSNLEIWSTTSQTHSKDSRKEMPSFAIFPAFNV